MVIQAHEHGTLLSVRVVPRSSKTVVEGVVEGALRIRLAAPPVDGAANAALIELLARRCGIPKSQISIVSGARGKQKRVLLSGIEPSTVRTRLELGAN
ncbi:MAG TPA: DUF167 domain-containing protein [Nitrolancea sp.]|nr:DUF167 domain-containing protein [Nitrolancea sp.]